MTRTEHLLTLLSEECNETGQRVSKALRFGLEEIQEGQELTNAQRILYEFCDIIAVVSLLKQEGILSEETYDMEQAINLKRSKIVKWLGYSETCGTIEKQELKEFKREMSPIQFEREYMQSPVPDNSKL